ncbi:MAG TPA: HAD-IA family hydrolase [Syntrophales bacterium]|nr:HAD-IA family hydrolase [Syntrophales bacterium]
MISLKLLVFDLDGTLADTGTDLAESVNRTLQSLGIATRPAAEILGFVGDGVRKLIERSLGDAYPDRFPEALEQFQAIYAEHLLDHTILYPDVLDVLRHFDGKDKVLITNKTLDFTRAIVNGLGINGFFKEIVAGDSAAFMKPDPRLLLPLFDRFGAAPAETLVVGDGVNDILLARNAGARSCAFLNGLGRRKELLGLRPDFTIERMIELKDIAS